MLLFVLLTVPLAFPLEAAVAGAACGALAPNGAALTRSALPVVAAAGVGPLPSAAIVAGATSHRQEKIAFARTNARFIGAPLR